MRILHSADWHYGEYLGPVINGVNARLMDIDFSVERLVDYAIQAEVDVLVIAGDFFKTKRPSFAEIKMVAKRLRDAAEAGIVVIGFEGNHDKPNDGLAGPCEILADYNIPNVHIVSRPTILNIRSTQFACLPYFSKSNLLARDEYKDLDPEEVNRVLSQKVSDIVYGLKAQMIPGFPSVLAAHMTVVGCELDNGEHVFLAQEPVLPIDTLKGCGFDLVMLGHIHKAQHLVHVGNVFYSGSPERLSFNEEGQAKGFYLHEITDEELSSDFIELDARKFLTINLTENDIHKFVEDGDDLFAETAKDAIVRVKYQASDELAKRLSHKELTVRLYTAGAHYVHSIVPEITRTSRARDEDVTEELTVSTALDKYMRKNGIRNDRAAELANDLIREVEIS